MSVFNKSGDSECMNNNYAYSGECVDCGMCEQGQYYDDFDDDLEDEADEDIDGLSDELRTLLIQHLNKANGNMTHINLGCYTGRD